MGKDGENPLKKAIYKYIHRFYPNLDNLPDIQLLAEKDYDSQIVFPNQGATYDEISNTIYFKEVATPTVVCREVHRWSQYQKMGFEQYYSLIRNTHTKFLLETEAITAASEAVYRHRRFVCSFRLFGDEIIEFFR